MTVFLLQSVSACRLPFHKEDKRLELLDSLLLSQPAIALDSLIAINPEQYKKKNRAYFSLLLTIAQHKNRVPFESDSLIASSRAWYEHSRTDPHKMARAQFYNGLVRYKKDNMDTSAYQLMRRSLQTLDVHRIQDNRLQALANAYLGRANDFHANNLQEAIRFYKKAVEAEKNQGNIRNLLIDGFDLLVCLVKNGETEEASSVKQMLDSVAYAAHDIHVERQNNAKAIYFLYSELNLDSALFYCQKWKASASDICAKENMMARIHAQRGQMDSAILYEKAAFEHRRAEDTLSFHLYYRYLADYYSQTGPADSAAHYARLAYAALRDNLDQKTQKRILELEKKYDVAEQAAKYEQMRHSRNVILLLFAFALTVCALFFWQWRLLRKNVAMQQREELRDSIFKSVLQAAAVTYAGVNKKLAHIHNLPDEKKQEALVHFIQDNKIQAANNLLSAVETNIDKYPETVQQITSLLDGAQQKTVFVLTELEFTPGDISGMLGITSAQVRMVKKQIRDRIRQTEIGCKRAARQLKVMQLGTQVGKK